MIQTYNRNGRAIPPPERKQPLRFTIGMPRPIFVAATRQHVGKTTVSLALMSGLKKRFEKVGFIKPVGQQYIPVADSSGHTIQVDKDVQVMKEFFSLNHIEYADMSPVIIPKGYTSK